MLLLTGTLLALTPTIAQLYGAGRVSETGAVARQAMMLGLVLGTIVFWVLQKHGARISVPGGSILKPYPFRSGFSEHRAMAYMGCSVTSS